ncbi:carboxypeptidase-like regulatory domain-containing protein [Flavobacterium orientale]|nr:carboxypeptidase-like regulatory domain-containing protein [Flavobacterium orientale]
MRFFTVLLFILVSFASFSQKTFPDMVKVNGVIKDDNSLKLLSNVHIINFNTVKGTITNEKGYFEIDAQVNDTLHISILGYQSIRVRVTNDWINSKSTEIKLTEKAYALEEVVVTPYTLTGYLEIDAKIIPIPENYRYGISGLSYGYEAGSKSPNAISRVVSSLFNPADLLYNFFGKKPNELKKLKEMKKDDTVRSMLENKFDRETISIMLGVDKKEIPEILHRCNYSETFIKTANDLQVLDAISDCYEEYKILKKK